MDLKSTNPSPSPVRVLTRPPPPPPSSTQSPSPTTTIATSSSSSPSPQGVVVVGFIGTTPSTQVTSLLNRILDASNPSTGSLPIPSSSQSISYFHRSNDDDDDNGTLFLYFSSSQHDNDHLRATLFLFTVCHVIIFLHDGLRFDTQILKKLRLLQSSKHALAPFLRSQITPPAASSKRRGVSKPSVSVSALPGNCIPVLLFVLSGNLHLSRGKKLYSFLDSQIRFLIKKCRLLAGPEVNTRGASNSNSLPLFSVDATRVLVLVDGRLNQAGEALDFVTGLLSDEASTDMVVMLEKKCQDVNDDGIQAITDFISRQSDALRGRGTLPSNSNSGSVAGVGMVAVAAAAAAAASVGAGKQVSAAPELPSLQNWLALSKVILGALVSTRHGDVEENGCINTQPPKNCVTNTRDDGIAAAAAVSYLEGSTDINMRFSLAWCQRALPVAMEVYLKDLPPCYPTALHNARLGRALHSFKSMVKGPAVQMFARKLEDECLSIWESGRQLCDAVSLTGKPCMRKRHNIKTCDGLSENVQEHSSGYYFLHACDCGRSRRLLDDPFDFDSAKRMSSCSFSCKDVIPSLILPESSIGPHPPYSWNLLRLGGAQYYEPSKGLLHIGFVSREKFLLKWIISYGKQKWTSLLSTNAAGSTLLSTLDLKASPVMKEEEINPYASGISSKVNAESLENRKTSSLSVSSGNTSISFGKGIPSFTMKKPFSEVVAGTAVEESSFPLLQQSNQPKASPAKSVGRVSKNNERNREHAVDGRPTSQKSESTNIQISESNCQTEGDTFQQIGSDVVPMNVFDDGNRKRTVWSNQMIVYVGFEYECSYGHRFLLSMEHLKDLHPFYSEDSQGKHDETSNILHAKAPPNSSRSSKGVTKGNNKISKPQAKASVADELGNASSACSLLNKNLPVYMNCPHCKMSKKQDQQNIKFARTVSQLQRIFLVTPPFPCVLATCPVIQFEDESLPPSIPAREKQSRFTFGCQVILPPESFLTLRLPFVYGVQKDDRSLQPLNHLEHHPELTAWLVKGTALQVVSLGQ